MPPLPEIPTCPSVWIQILNDAVEAYIKSIEKLEPISE